MDGRYTDKPDMPAHIDADVAQQAVDAAIVCKSDNFLERIVNLVGADEGSCITSRIGAVLQSNGINSITNADQNALIQNVHYQAEAKKQGLDI